MSAGSDSLAALDAPPAAPKPPSRGIKRLARLSEVLRPHKGRFALATVALFTGSSVSLVYPQAVRFAVDEGVVHRVATDSALTEVWAEVGEDVTSLVRDPFTGRIFISVTSARILEYTPDGTLLGEWESPGERGRLAYSPDGYLYYLISGWPTRAEVLRYALPETL